MLIIRACFQDAQTVTAAESDRRIKSLEAEARNRNIEAYNKDVEITRLRGEAEILRVRYLPTSPRNVADAAACTG